VESVLETSTRVLEAQGSTLGGAFLEFAAFNAATGERAAADRGYRNAAQYPAVPLTAFDAAPGASLEEIASGLGAYYYRATVTEPIELRVEADPARIAALMLPIAADGTVDPAAARPLPATAEGDVIVVVAGQSLARTDAPFTLLAAAPDSADGASDSSGCALGGHSRGADSGAGALLAVAALVVRRRRLKGLSS
jgi:hypothetical protein